MKKFNVIFVLMSLLFVACGPVTKLTSSWTNEPETPKSYEKLAVAALFPDNSNRYLVESGMVKTMKENNIKCTPTFDIFPLAGRIGGIAEVVKDPEALRRGVKLKVEENNIDALMIITLFNQKTEKRFVSDRNFAMGGTGYYGTSYYTGSYYDYYSYSIGTVYNDGYYVEDITYFLECNLYDVATEKLLWTGHTKSMHIESVEEEALYFSEIIVKELLKKQVITP